MNSEQTTAPLWFQDNVSQPGYDAYIEVEASRIHYQYWPSLARQGLLFVHGHAAHSHWWDFIAPAFIERYQVATIDLSGNGDSDHRCEYTAVTYGHEIKAVAGCFEDRGLKPIIVGHSFGGSMTRIAAHLFPDDFAAYILIDSVLSSSKGSRLAMKGPRDLKKPKRHIYDSRAQGQRRFRLKPPQPCDNKYLLDHIAHHSLRQGDEGYEFKLDQQVFAKMVEHPDIDLPDAVSMIRDNELAAAFIYGKLSRFFPEGSQGKLESLFGTDRVIGINQAHHHVFLDQPELFIQALDKLLNRLKNKT